MTKKLYDITFTVAMSEKQYKRLCDADDRALERDENLPLWEAGLDMRDFLLVFYGVKAKLKRWRFGRNFSSGSAATDAVVSSLAYGRCQLEEMARAAYFVGSAGLDSETASDVLDDAQENSGRTPTCETCYYRPVRPNEDAICNVCYCGDEWVPA